MTTERRAIRLGLTGPIGCGKSTVAGWIGERDDARVIDADRVARDVLAPGRPELDAVFARFGRELATDDGSLDRAALARIVFTDPDALLDLERIVHPAVRVMIRDALAAADAAGVRIVVVEAIKLVEGGLADDCDAVWLVTCGGPTQLERLVARGTSAADAAARIATQGDIAGRAGKRASAIIETSGSPAATRQAVEAALADLLRTVSPTA